METIAFGAFIKTLLTNTDGSSENIGSGEDCFIIILYGEPPLHLKLVA